MTKQTGDILPEAEAWGHLEEERQNQEEWRKGLGEIHHTWPDGWTMRRLRNGEEAEQEGMDMGNCVGGDQYGYRPAIDSGNLHVYSLRSPYNKPHATVAIDPDGSIECVEDRSGSMGQKYKDRVNEWYAQHQHNLSYDGYGKGGYGGPFDMPAADDVRSYLDLHGEDGNYHEYMPDEAQYQEDPDLRWQTPEWDRIAYDMYAGGPYAPSDEDRRAVFNTAIDNRHFEELNKAMELSPAQAQDPEQVRVHQQWQDWAKPHYHPLTGQFVLPAYGEKPIAEQFQNPLFQEPQCRNCGQKGEHASWCGGLSTRHGPQGGPPEPQPLDIQYPNYQEPAWNRVLPTDQYHNGPTPLTYSKTAASFDPLYYRWVFSPASGEVTLAHNLEDDPKLHGDLARERNEPGLVHGYAYRIGGGWRLTDWEHRPVEDPYVVAQVMRKLRDEEGYTPAEDASEGDWDEAPDFSPRP
jgi:hypothetical protein